MSQPWFPFYVGDYVRDTARLTTEGHGAYLLLMLDYWANGAPPDDDETLSSIARLSLPAWLAIRHKLLPFFRIADGKWFHGRIEKERDIAAERHQKRVDAGKRGGDAKAKAKHSSSIARLSLPALPYQPQPQPQSIKKKKSRTVAVAPPPVRADRFEEFWKAYPRRDGANPRSPAEKKFSALVRSGIDPQVMIAGAAALAMAESGKGNVGTKFIPQAMTWLNQQRWSDHAEVANLLNSATPEMQIEAAVAMYVRLNRWSRFAGPEPGMPGCRASAELLARHGLQPDGRKIEIVHDDASAFGE